MLKFENFIFSQDICPNVGITLYYKQNSQIVRFEEELIDRCDFGVYQYWQILAKILGKKTLPEFKIEIG